METHPVGGSRRALIVDDDPMVGVLLDNLVGSFGFTMGRARTVSEARKMMTSLDPEPSARLSHSVTGTQVQGFASDVRAHETP